MARFYAAAALFGAAAAQVATTTEPTLPEIEAAAATTLPYSPVSNVKGVAFQRFYQIWLENVDYSAAAGDANQQWLAKQGIQLTNYYAAGHVSEPNYCAAASGDLYGMDNDAFHQVPGNVSTVVDLLDTKGIAWAEYQQDEPYPGFQGFNYSNQQTMANDYVRKHNPLVLFDSVAANATRLRQIKNFTSFADDLAAKTLPQWAFITPNMTNDGHDTNVTFGSAWLRSFVEPLMSNEYFWNDTLLLLTFDESEHYALQNRVFSVLLGGAVPADLVGTTDDTVYTHYSSIASVSANWGLPSLGRWDCGANLWKFVADKTGYTNYDVDTTNLYVNVSLPGPLSEQRFSEYVSSWPVPATSGSCSAGHGILPAVQATYKGMTPTFNYSAPFPYDAAVGLDADVAYSKDGVTRVSGVNATTVIASSSSSASSSASSTTASASASASATAKSAAVGLRPTTGGVAAALAAVVLASVAGALF